MSEAAAPAPGGAVAEAPAEMGTEQQAALAEVARLRAEWSKAPSEGRDAIGAKISKLQRFAFGHGEKPADFMPGDPPPPDLRPADSLRDTFEALNARASESQMKSAINLAILQGVHPELAREAGALCAELQLSDRHARAVLDRVRAHATDKEIRVLDESEIQIWADESARILGGRDKLQTARTRAEEYLKSIGVAEKWAAEGFWASTLSFDGRFLHALAMAGLSRGGK